MATSAPPPARNGAEVLELPPAAVARAEQVALRQGGSALRLPPFLTAAAAPMRRKQKRLLQAVGLALAALVFLPNVGLWSLYRERQLEGGGASGGEGAAVGPPGAAAGEAAVSEWGRCPEGVLAVRGAAWGGRRALRCGAVLRARGEGGRWAERSPLPEGARPCVSARGAQPAPPCAGRAGGGRARLSGLRWGASLLSVGNARAAFT